MRLVAHRMNLGDQGQERHQRLAAGLADPEVGSGLDGVECVDAGVGQRDDGSLGALGLQQIGRLIG